MSSAIEKDPIYISVIANVVQLICVGQLIEIDLSPTTTRELHYSIGVRDA